MLLGLNGACKYTNHIMSHVDLEIHDAAFWVRRIRETDLLSLARHRQATAQVVLGGSKFSNLLASIARFSEKCHTSEVFSYPRRDSSLRRSRSDTQTSTSVRPTRQAADTLRCNGELTRCSGIVQVRHANLLVNTTKSHKSTLEVTQWSLVIRTERQDAGVGYCLSDHIMTLEMLLVACYGPKNPSDILASHLQKLRS
jgi:hypothetical protein